MNPKFKNLLKFLIIFTVFIWVWICFYNINNLNYIKFREIRLETVNHPENLPTKQFAKNTSFWFDNIRADIFRLETIQYIGSNAVSSAYKKYLYQILDLITDLNPYFDHPYKIWMLLLPDYNPRYEWELTNDEELEYIKQWEELWLKWIDNFCDKDKINLILKEDNLQKIWTLDKYKNPCRNYEIPYYLAYIYYFHLQDPIKASDYYKIASANENSVEWAKVLAAIMRWKGWDREKAFLMFLNIWKSLDDSEQQICNKYIDVLEWIWYKIFRENEISSDVIKYVNESRTKIFWEFDEERDDSVASDSQCSNYVNKSIRELNLHYIELANINYKKDNSWENAFNAKILYDNNYIDYLPIDFQQYEDYGIIYKYSEETKNFDYEMWNYE